MKKSLIALAVFATGAIYWWNTRGREEHDMSQAHYHLALAREAKHKGDRRALNECRNKLDIYLPKLEKIGQDSRNTHRASRAHSLIQGIDEIRTNRFSSVAA